MLFNRRVFICLSPEGDGAGGGGNATPTIAELQAQLQALTKENEKLKAKPTKTDPPGEGDQGDLGDKARKDKEAREAKGRETEEIQSAVKFNMGMPDFMKNNHGLIPESFAGIVEAANKEKYETEVHKAKAIRAALIKDFFSQQANLDRLTESQKKKIADFLAMTQPAREDQASSVFESVFEPTLETIRQIKKAEQVSRANKGHANSSDASKAYAKRMMELSQKAHLVGGAK